MARFLSCSFFPASESGSSALTATNLAAAFWASRSLLSRCSRSNRTSRAAYRVRAAWANPGDQASQPVWFWVTPTIVMQSTGQGGIQRSQPVHQSLKTTCICFEAPTIASTGQAWMQSVQPIQVLGSMKATGRARSMPHSGLIVGCSSNASLGKIGTRIALSLLIPSTPPGGQRLGNASPQANASA